MNRKIPFFVFLAIIIIEAILFVGWILYQNSMNSRIDNYSIIFEDYNKKISEEDAISFVKDLPEVKEWLGLFSEDNTGEPIIELDSELDGEYLIHVYEILSDHTATFNWYTVDLETKEIKPMF